MGTTIRVNSVEVSRPQLVGEIKDGRLDTEGMLSYGGVGAKETAPKWLLSAVEIMQADSEDKQDKSYG